MIERLSSKTFAILILIIFFISFALYHSSLNYYFFQDDFFEINISKAQNLGQYLEFFKFRDDIIAYRPISLQNYFFLSLKIFGFDPSGFRVLTFALLFSSAILSDEEASSIRSTALSGKNLFVIYRAERFTAETMASSVIRTP